MQYRVRRRYFRYTPRRLGFIDGDQVFYEFAMDRRWSFFKVYAWGQVHIFRFGGYVVVCVGAAPLQRLEALTAKKLRRGAKEKHGGVASMAVYSGLWF